MDDKQSVLEQLPISTLLKCEGVTVGELKNFIQDSVNEAVAKHVCRFAVTDEVVDKIPDLINSVRHIGDGDIDKGIIRIQDNHRSMTILRQRRDALSIKIANFIMLALMGGLVSALWLGLKAIIKQE